MLNNEISQIIVSGAVTILTGVIALVGKEVVKLIVTKREEVNQKIKDSGYKTTLDKAFEVWKIVDDKFRLTENALNIFGSKEKLFEKILLQQIPGLTQKNIDDLRDTVSGEINKGRETLLAPVDNSQAQIFALQQEKNNALLERDNIQAKLDQLTKAFNQVNDDNKTMGIASNTEAPAGPNLNQNI